MTARYMYTIGCTTVLRTKAEIVFDYLYNILKIILEKQPLENKTISSFDLSCAGKSMYLIS